MPLGGFAPLPLRLGGNAEDGLTAAQHARICADLVAAVKTAEFALIGLTTGATDVRSYQAQHGTGVANAPTITAGFGWVKATWPTGYVDPYNNYQAVRITQADASVETTLAVLSDADVDAPNEVTVRTYNQLGAAADGYNVFLVVH